MPKARVRRALALGIIGVTAVTSVTLWAAESIRVVPLVRDGQVLVSFELAEGFSEDVRAAIQSGLRTTFTYTVELRLAVPLWMDKTIESVTASATVQYDNLTRRHHVSRSLDGRIEDARVVEDEATVQQLMTTFERLALFRRSQLEPNREYYVRVQGRARPRNALFFWPWDSGPSGHATFTFIP